ncbi:MAG: FAD-dependent oxidoreductase [Bacteroidota bacterium]
MTRAEFVKICGIFGLGLPFQFSLMPGGIRDEMGTPFKGKVLIIGAGAGGLSAGYFLRQQGTDFEILEASGNYGGRMRINTDFADFPIPLGAEWLETKRTIFREIVNDPKVPVTIETIRDGVDRKFVNYSWYSFFEEYIVPSIKDSISYDTVVRSIDYSGNQIVVRTDKGQHMADKVVISVPLKILQDGDIRFTPSLPPKKREAIDRTVIWDGFKAFFEFSAKFYDDEYSFRIRPARKGQKMYYNAALGQNTTKHILGLFTVGTPAQDYISRSENDLKAFILSELDSIYDNRATPNYVNHIVQNWNNEPFIKAGYMTDHENPLTVRKLAKSVADKLYFAGGAYTNGTDWVSVHTAARSAMKTIVEINGA